MRSRLLAASAPLLHLYWNPSDHVQVNSAIYSRDKNQSIIMTYLPSNTGERLHVSQMHDRTTVADLMTFSNNQKSDML